MPNSMIVPFCISIPSFPTSQRSVSWGVRVNSSSWVPRHAELLKDTLFANMESRPDYVGSL